MAQGEAAHNTLQTSNKAVKQLSGFLEDPQPYLRERAAKYLAPKRNPEAITPLLERLHKEPRFRIRIHIGFALARLILPSSEKNQPQKKLKTRPKKHVKDAAKWAIDCVNGSQDKCLKASNNKQ